MKKEEERKKSWILERTFELFAQKSKALRRNNSSRVKTLGKEVRKSLRLDRKRRIWLL